jgi:hypothetical protein
MDFVKINHPNEHTQTNTNNKHVRLQQHVVLDTVIEHAEDIIIKKIYIKILNYITDAPL